MQPELVSVIVPCHNRPDYLRQCLRSLAQQTYPDVELIVVDDDSEEDILAVVNDIAFPFPHPPRYVRSDQNRGPGFAREQGRLLARGEFLCYLDSDDLWHPEKIETQVKDLRDHPDAGMCYCVTAEFDSLPIPGDAKLRRGNERPVGSFLPQVLYQRPWSTSACMWRRNAIDQIGPWFDTWVWEDYEYDCRAGCHDIPIVFVDRVLSYYRATLDPQHLSNLDSRRKAQQRARSLLEMLHHLEEHHKLEDGAIRDRLAYLLFSQSMILLDHDEQILARNCLHAVFRLDAFSSPTTLSSWLVLRMQHFLPPVQAARFGRRLRHMLLPNPTLEPSN